MLNPTNNALVNYFFPWALSHRAQMIPSLRPKDL